MTKSRSEASQEKRGETRRLEQLLKARLADKCPVPKPRAQSRSRLLARLEEQALLAVSGSVGQALADARIDLDIVRDIKDRYKEQASRAADKREQHVCTALYFGAIARALVSHGRRITRYPTDYLLHSFQVLAGEPWMLPPLRELYLKAQQACEQES